MNGIEFKASQKVRLHDVNGQIHYFSVWKSFEVKGDYKENFETLKSFLDSLANDGYIQILNPYPFVADGDEYWDKIVVME